MPSAARAPELRIATGVFGAWSVLLELVPFGADGVGRLHRVDASATHEGITVHVSGLSFTPDTTAIRFEAVGDDSVQRVIGVGGLHGLLAGANELLLRDEHGREHYGGARQATRTVRRGC